MSMVRRSKAQWLALFESQVQSGLSSAQFCRRNKLCPKYFSKRKQDLNYTPKPASAFSRVIAQHQPKATQPVLTLIHGHSKLVFSPQPSAEFISRLLTALR